MFEIIWTDMQQPISYLLPGAAAGAVLCLILELLTRLCRNCSDQHRSVGPARRSFRGKRLCARFLLFSFLSVLAGITFFSREPGSRSSVNLILGGTWGASLQARAYVIENLLMMLPFGFLLPTAFPKLSKWTLCTGAGFLLSLLIELVQLLTQRGYCQLDDLVMNTLGTLIGWGIWRMLASIFENNYFNL
ncbi:MAG: VanZ family protein [Lachnospiraceae bacterium]